MLRYRYPGVQQFESEDAYRFFGRDRDIADLYDLVLLEKLVVLFGKSGYGKSSLLNAGIIPRLQESRPGNAKFFLPIQVRFGPYTLGYSLHPLEQVRRRLDESLEPNPDMAFIDTLDSRQSLWAAFKRRQQENQSLQCLLIFDQFEELFTYPEDQQEAFKRGLAQLLYEDLPDDLFDSSRTLDKTNRRRLMSPMDVRAVFAIRSDRMHFLDRLKDQLPAILHKRFELRALTPEQAKDAIVEPAGLSRNYQGHDFISERFDYTPEALDFLLTNLSDGGQGISTGVEAFLLQIVCQYVEKQVAEGHVPDRTGDGVPDVSQDDLPPDFHTVYEAYYKSKIDELPFIDRLPARLVMEEGLLFVNETSGEFRRLSKDPGELVQTYGSKGVTKELLLRLEQTYLLRKEANTVGTFNYEISHDTLIAPILKARQSRKAEEERAELNRRAKEAEARAGEESRRREEAEKLRVEAKRALALARRRTKEAKMAMLVAHARTWHQKDPTLAVRLAEAAYKTLPTSESAGVLCDILSDPKAAFVKLVLFPGQYVKAAVNFSPDSRRFIRWADTGLVQIWTLQGALVQEFQSEVKHVDFVCFSPDGTKILTIGACPDPKKTVWLWDLSGNELARLEGHTDRISSACFSPNGKYILTASQDLTVKIWNIDGENWLSFDLESSSGYVPIAFSPDGNRFIFRLDAFEGVVSLYDLKENSIRTFSGHDHHVDFLHFSPNGSLVLGISQKDGKCFIWDWKWDEQWRFVLNVNRILSVHIFPDGSGFYTGSADGTIYCWNWEGKETGRFDRYNETKFTNLCFSPDGKYMLSDSGKRLLWETQGSEIPVTGFQVNGDVLASCFTPDNSCFLTSYYDGFAEIWNLKGEKILRFDGVKGIHDSACFSPDGQLVLTWQTGSSQETGGQIWNIKGELLHYFEGAIKTSCFSPDSKRVLIGYHFGAVIMWDLSGNKVLDLQSDTVRPTVQLVSFSPDGKLILIGFWGIITLFDLKGVVQWSFEIEANDTLVHSACFFAEGARIAVSSLYKIYILDFQGRKVSEFPNPNPSIVPQYISSDGNLIFLSNNSGALFADFQGHVVQRFEATQPCLSPDGNLVLMFDQENNARLRRTANYLLSPENTAPLSLDQKLRYRVDLEPSEIENVQDQATLEQCADHFAERFLETESPEYTDLLENLYNRLSQTSLANDPSGTQFRQFLTERIESAVHPELQERYRKIASVVFSSPDFLKTIPRDLNITIRVMPAGNEVDVVLPAFSTGKEIIETLLNKNLAPYRAPDGIPYIYELFSKFSNKRIEAHKTLYDLGIRDGETIYFIPKLIAGGGSLTKPNAPNEVITIVIRVMPNGDELDVELPDSSTGAEIITELLHASVAPKSDPEGNPYAYELISMRLNLKIETEKTLYESGVMNGDVVYFVPKLVAGGISDRPLKAVSTPSALMTLVVRTMPKGDEFDIELPAYTTGAQFISELLETAVAPKADPAGNPYVYELIGARSNLKIAEEKSLFELGIMDGEVIYFVPKLVAGGPGMPPLPPGKQKSPISNMIAGLNKRLKNIFGPSRPEIELPDLPNERGKPPVITVGADSSPYQTYSHAAHDVVAIVLKVMPKGDEFDVEVPLFTTAREFIDEIINANYALRTNENGQAIYYRLVKNDLLTEIPADQSLHAYRIAANDTLYMLP